MDQRSRGGRPNRRKTLPTSSIRSDTSAGGESTSSIMTRSPPVAASRTPQTAPPNRRNAKPIPMNTPFSVRSSPSTSASGPGKTAHRKKSRTGFDGAADEEDETYRKGPHTLRKRTKIDYSAADFEDELPEIAIPAPRTATRKRRADSEVADEEYYTPAAQKRRATSRDFSVASGTAARRRTPARRSVVEQQSFYSQPSDEDIVKDTIEVVGDSSDLVSSDDASEHEDDENDVSGRISLPEKHEQPSSPIQRRTQEVHQLASPIEQQQVVKQDDSKPSQAQGVSGIIAAAAGINSGPIIAHPQPIRLNQVTIINSAGPRPDPEPATTHRSEFSEDFSFQPKREASSPVRPTESLPQRTALPEAAGSATGPAVILGSQENSVSAVAENYDATVNNGHVTVAPPPADEAPQPGAQRNAHEEIVDNHVKASEYELPPREQPQSSQPTTETYGTASRDVDIAEPLTTHPKEPPQPKDEVDVDASEEFQAAMQVNAPVQQQKAASPQPSFVPQVTKKRFAWSHLTPYIDGEYVTHSIYPVMVEASAPTSNADAAEASGDTENVEEATEPADPNTDGHHAEAEGDEDGNADADGEIDDADRDAEHDEDLAPDSQGQQLSQGSAYDSAAPTPALTPRQGSPVLLAAATGTSTPAPLMPKQRFRKQYKFKKIRDPTEFTSYLKDTKDLSDEELWDLLEKANECLVAYQDEYKKCTRIVDDQENAQRRAVQDAAFEKKTADLNAFAKVDSYIEKDFDVQGSRATIKEKDAGILEQRWQDKVMANAYGFEYDPHPNKIGNQDPGAQRDGGGEGGRQLRSQPQASAKAAEGDGVIVSGKRTRNPPKLFDGVLQDDHRAATPGVNKPLPKRRGRAAAADKAAAAQDQELEAEAEPYTTSPARPGPKKRGPRGRKAAVVVSEPGTPVPEEDAFAPPPEPEQAQPPKRKRGRQPKSAAVVIEQPGPEELEKPTPKRGRAAKRQSNGHVSTTAETTDESRPTSSSSNATISDDGSTYGLRQNKRPRNWKEEASADEEEVEAEPKPKKPRIIRINRKQSAPELAPKRTASERILTELHDFSVSSTAPDSPRLTVSFKLIGKDQWTLKPAASPRQTSTDVSEYNLSTPRPAPVSAPTSTKSSAPPSQAGEEKDYSTMTKSEKMSASMKKRWLNGSMQGAVNKRKATLAAKKQAAAQAEAQAAQAAQQKAMQFQQIGPFPMGPSQ